MGYIRQNLRRPKGSTLVRGKCFIEGCNRQQASKGKDKKGRTVYRSVCFVHHGDFNNKTNTKTDFMGISSKYRTFPNGKCEICGWDKAPCDRHRFEKEKGYVVGNVLVVCPNHHRMITYGVIKINAENRVVNSPENFSENPVNKKVEEKPSELPTFSEKKKEGYHFVPFLNRYVRD